MSLETNLNVAPYFDDFDETKNYHRILFKPEVAVQARELTQLQSILQNQIERFGDHTFLNGSVVKGCGVAFYDPLHYVRLSDRSSEGTLVDVSILQDATARSIETGLVAKIINTKIGSEDQYPVTNRVYVRYLNTGALSNNDIKVFRPNEALEFITGDLSANNVVLTSNTYANTTANTFTSDTGIGIGVGDGIVYQKGFFIRVEPQIIVVTDTKNAGNTSIGFSTTETIINSEQDPSILSNALGYKNRNAPGADRLKLTANLISVETAEIENKTDFAVIAQYIGGAPVIKETNPQYAVLGDEMARSKYEESGSYVVKPFNVDTIEHSSNTEWFTARVSPGIGYAQGHRVELIHTAPVTIRRGTDIDNAEDQVITTNYGNYVIVSDLAGTFDFDRCEEVQIYNVKQNALTNRNFSGAAPAGTLIGVANMRAHTLLSGTPGTPSAQYAIYIFNIRMNSGYSFAQDAKALYYNGTTKGIADIELNDSRAVMYGSERRSLLWNFGKPAIKRLTDENGNVSTQYQFRTKSTTTLATNGNAPITLTTSHAGGTNKFPHTVGAVVGDSNERKFTMVALSAGQTGSLAGTISASNGSSTVTGSSTSFLTQYNIGDYITWGSVIRRITAIASNISMTVDAVATAAASGSSHSKYIPQGYVFPLNDNRAQPATVTINSETSATIAVGLIAALTAPIPVAVYHNILRTNTVPAKKKINKNLVVKIQTANNTSGSTGPWNLGVPDVHKVRGIYAGNTATGQNYVDNFVFDHGMRDTMYDHGKLFLKGGSSLPATNMTVVFDAFTANTTPGVGFFTVESYPIDDANTANVNSITTAEIPLYVTETGGSVSLRDSVDFRPYKDATTTLATTAGSATINPPATSNFFVDSLGQYVPAPDENFQADIEYYLGRKDLIYFSSRGYLKSIEGVPSEKPKSPSVPDDGMGVAELSIKPFPSLATSENAINIKENKRSLNLNRITNYETKINIVTNRRYTMKDIGVLDRRISRIEYYTALNMLEKAATDIQVSDENGLNRFKNGIFVEPFTSHLIGDVSNNEYRISIDKKLGVARPYFSEEREDFSFSPADSTSIVKTGRLLTLPYTTVTLDEQPFATKVRNAAPVQYAWTGSMKLFPTYDHNIDKGNPAQLQVSIDLASPWQDFANSPWGTNYGDWRTTASSTAASTSVTTAEEFQVGTTTTATTTNTTTTTAARDVQKMNIDVTNTEYNLGNFVEDITIQPYIASREIAFFAWNLRPNTTVNVFFDDDNVSEHCAPGTLNPAVADPLDDRIVVRSAAWGTGIRVDANGQVYGKFRIPVGRFRVGERRLRVVDVSNMAIEGDAVTTQASATYVASNMSLTSKSLTLTTINPEMSFNSTTESRVTTSSTTSTNQTFVPFIPPAPPVQQQQFEEANGGGDDGPDPLAQMFRINAPTNVSGTYLTEIGVYFAKKPTDNSNAGVTLYVTEVTNGYPNGAMVLPFTRTHKNIGEVNISADGTTETTFVFESPVYMGAGKQYSFIILPDGGHPDYLVWMAELGEADVATGAQVFSKPYIDPAFYSTNQSTWSALQNEYVKFRLGRAKFSVNAGTSLFYNRDTDYMTVSGVTAISGDIDILAGDMVYGSANTSANTISTTVVGRVKSYDPVNNKLHIKDSSGTFTTSELTTLQVHRLATDNASPSSNTLLATANLVSVDNIPFNAIVPRVAMMEPPGTKLTWSFGADTDSGVYQVPTETETEMYDYSRALRSRSNEVKDHSGIKSLRLQSRFYSDNEWISPAVDLVRTNALFIQNIIDGTGIDLTPEHGNTGTAKTKYISKPITLASGQDSDDLRVFVTGYRPSGSEIIVYAKFLNGEDSERLTDKKWTRLVNDNSTTYSDFRNVTDYREFVYTVPNAVDVIPNLAHVDPAEGLTYTGSDGSTYVSFKTFALKIVLLADNPARVPRLSDTFAIALQL